MPLRHHLQICMGFSDIAAVPEMLVVVGVHGDAAAVAVLIPWW